MPDDETIMLRKTPIGGKTCPDDVKVVSRWYNVTEAGRGHLSHRRHDAFDANGEVQFKSLSETEHEVFHTAPCLGRVYGVRRRRIPPEKIG